MDIPSVRFQPVPEQAQAAITSTQGHPRLIWPVRPKFNSSNIVPTHELIDFFNEKNMENKN